MLLLFTDTLNLHTCQYLGIFTLENLQKKTPTQSGLSQPHTYFIIRASEITHSHIKKGLVLLNTLPYNDLRTTA